MRVSDKGVRMNQENLYEEINNKICQNIFDGKYNDGDRLPAERILAEQMGVSRVTVRKTMEILEEERLVKREVGRGTIVTLENAGNCNNLDMIVLVAPARNPFFSEFIERFQRYAETVDSLVLYVEKPRTESLEKCLYRLYRRGLRNIVVWLEDLPVNADKLRRLRAMGMNLVFFDTDKGLPYADCVSLDNALAIETLYQQLRKKGYRSIVYTGWDFTEIYSIEKREQTYRDLCDKEAMVIHIPWKNREEAAEKFVSYIQMCQKNGPDAVICSDRESGEMVMKIKNDMGFSFQVASVDEISFESDVPAITYQQNLSASVKQIFACMKRQCELGREWTSDIYLLEGILTK